MTATAIKPDPDVDVIIEGEFIFYCGGTPRDCDVKYMASRIVAENEGIIGWLQRRERRRQLTEIKTG